jgi:radical SAM-linked protein
LGHLDLIRELPRVIRRAGVRTAYTEGFHPKPAMTFGPALALGVASLDEYVDAKLIDAPDPVTLLAALQAMSASGIRFLGAKPLGPNDPSVSRIITGARYVVGISAHAAPSTAELQQLIAALFARTEAKVRRNIDGVGKMVNVIQFLRTLELGGSDAERVMHDAGIVGGVVTLEAELAITQNGAAKISEVVEALFGSQQVPFVAVRSALRAGTGSPMDLELHRKSKETSAKAPLAAPLP